jgi:preprotein translocase subunit SecD
MSMSRTAMLLGMLLLAACRPGDATKSRTEPGQVELTYGLRLPSGTGEAERLRTAEIVRERLERRVSGLRERVTVERDGDRIVVRVPSGLGPSELERLKGFLPVPARFEFREVDGESLWALAGRVPAPAQVARERSGDPATATLFAPTREAAEIASLALAAHLRPGATVAYQRPAGEAGSWMGFLLGPIAIDNDGIRSAATAWNEDRPVVIATLTDEAAAGFEALTRRLVGRRMAITLDGQVLTAPYVTAPIPGGKIQIQLGKESRDEAITLALVLKIRAWLPVPLDLIAERTLAPRG